MKYIFFLLLVTVSCSPKADKTAKINEIVKTINESSRAQVKPQAQKPISRIKSYHTDANHLLYSFCSYLNGNTLSNPFVIGEFFTDSAFAAQAQNFTRLTKTIECNSSRVLIEDFPITIVEVDVKDHEYPMYFLFELNSDKVIADVYSFFDIRISIQKEMVETRDGTKLATYFLGDTRYKQTTALVRTPYLHSSSLTPFKYYQFFLQYNMNFVVQANRGTHSSEGAFKWLDKKNINDGADTIKWIKNQEHSNGKVLPWGISYDGFNALAAASSNEEGIIGTIACSAPANASTDSFSANRAIAKQLLRYIWLRENTSTLLHFEAKFNYLIDNGFNDYKNLDIALFGRDIDDWKELYSSLMNRTDTYWKERNLIPHLEKISTPILHVAGLDKDQDSRDSLLTYFSLNHLENHKLYLHNSGHGCGDLFYNAAFAKYLYEKSEHVEKNTIYSINQVQNYVYPQSYNGRIGKFEEFKFSPKRAIFDGYSQRRDYPHSVTMSKVIDKDIVINGVPELHFKVLNKTLKSYMTVSAWIVRPDQSTYKLHPQSYESIRTSYYFTSDTMEAYVKDKVLLYPSAHRVTKGSKIVIKLSTKLFHHIDFFKEERQNYYEENGDGSIEFPYGEESVKLLLPIEDEL